MLREILCNRGIQLVFLNVCDTGRDARGQLNRGVGQALMEGGLPAVVANQYQVYSTRRRSRSRNICIGRSRRARRSG